MRPRNRWRGAAPDAKLPPYTLACALARVSPADAGIEPALREAIRRAAAKAGEMRRHAAADEDLAALRAPGGPPWFADLVNAK